MGESLAKEFSVGQEIWLPCKMQSGPFPSERRVYLNIGASEWSGFVSTTDLDLERHLVRARVIGFGPGDLMTVSIRGHSPASHPIEASPAAVREQLHGSIYA